MFLQATRESVFFYGLFMDEDLLRQKGLNPFDFKLASVTGYGLRIGARATLEASKSEQVFGSVVTLKADELKRLYSEESVADYVPTRLPVTDMQGHCAEAISYILPMALLSGRNPGYARSLLVAADKIGLPGAYLKTIESWI